ncbi:MAG: tRNA pseudouridine(54/55) synthase Pus10 [Candidatus Micrarchaeota archaeon]
MRLCKTCNSANGNRFESGDCCICGNALDKFEEFVRKADIKLGKGDLFSISTYIPKKWLINEEKVWDRHLSESMKNYLNRKIISHIIKETGADYSINAINKYIFDFKKMETSREIEPLFVFGRYRKLIPGISQSRWFCKRCNGKGCNDCSDTGKNYVSIEEIVGEVFKKHSNCGEYYMHASGREDVDVTNIAGRAFVLEMKGPKMHKLDLGRIRKEIVNGVEISDLRFVDRGCVELVSNSHFNKQYLATVELDREFTEEDEKKIIELVGTVIGQRTPTRVAHRRADKIRKRKIIDLKVENQNRNMFDIYITAEAGTYIKELISGDGNKTKPNFSSLLGCKAECKKLIVTKIWDEFLD